MPVPKAGPTLAILDSSDPNALAETLVALANADGGQILIGAQGDPSSPVGAAVSAIEEDLRTAQGRVTPFIPAAWKEEETADGPVVVLRVESSRHLHSLIDGRVFRRAGSVNRIVLGPELHSLLRERPVSPTEEQPVFGATMEDLDSDLIQQFRQLQQQSGPMQAALPSSEFLQLLGALDLDGCPTLAGLLLFGKSPQKFLPFAQVVFVSFKDPGKGQAASAAHRYSRREEVGGPLFHIIAETYRLLRQEMETQSLVVGVTRVDRSEYPLSVVREALVNAVAHRDYSLTGRSIEIRLHEDAMEIISPGALPAHITLQNMLDEHYSRNPRIVKGLYHWGYIEELGLGIDLMYSELLRHGHPPPEFTATEHRFSVRMQRVRTHSAVPEASLDRMNDRQLLAVRHLQENGAITNGEYRKLCPGVSPETLRLDLAAMVDQNVLLRIGEKRGTRYILKSAGDQHRA